MLGFESKKPPITGEYAKKIKRWLRGEFTLEEKIEMEEAEKRLEKARKKWKVVWEDNKYGDISDI